MRVSSIVAVIFTFIISLAPCARADLGSFTRDLNVQARTDIDAYGVRLSAQFGVPEPEVRTIIRQVYEPADAFLCLELSQMTRQPPQTVVRTYRAHRGKGWGVIAKELGIKPGSPEFHRLKRGDFQLTGEPGGGPGGGHGRGHGNGGGPGHGHGKGRGHNK